MKKLILEALTNITRITPQADEDDEIDIDIDGIDDHADEFDSEQVDTFGIDAEDDDQLDQIAQQTSEDPNKQGVLRTVDKARLVYKRNTGDGTFEELWIYKSGTMRSEMEMRKAILAGTDIPVGSNTSEDGTQTFTTWTAGNAELIHITGLPN